MCRKKIGAVLLAAAVLLAGCSRSPAYTGGTGSDSADRSEIPCDKEELFAMDTIITITCYGEKCKEAAEAAVAEVNRLDALLSVGNPDSEVSVINANGSGPVSEDTRVIIREALRVWEETGGAFDITIYPLMVEWGFTTESFHVPEPERIRELLEHVDSGQICLDEEAGTVTIGEGQGIDLGGIAKGYTSDCLMEIFEEYELDSAVISLGGNVQCYKRKPDGSLWICAIEDPNHPLEDPNNPSTDDDFLGIVELDGQAAITSGAYERNFTDEETGNVYHHILDPATGYSAYAGLISVTVVSKSGILADTISTACYVMGLDDSLAYWEDHKDEFDLIMMTDDNTVYVTEGMKNVFTTDYPLVVVS